MTGLHKAKSGADSEVQEAGTMCLSLETSRASQLWKSVEVGRRKVRRLAFGIRYFDLGYDKSLAKDGKAGLPGGGYGWAGGGYK